MKVENLSVKKNKKKKKSVVQNNKYFNKSFGKCLSFL